MSTNFVAIYEFVMIVFVSISFGMAIGLGLHTCKREVEDGGSRAIYIPMVGIPVIATFMFMGWIGFI